VSSMEQSDTKNTGILIVFDYCIEIPLVLAL
jgi:hypothetical protein